MTTKMNYTQLIVLVVFAGLILTFARRLPAFSLERPISLLMSLVGLSLGGLLAFWVLPVELMPNASFGVITITTPVRGGMSPTEIERQVTKPVEEAVSTVSHVRNLVSHSANGKSVVSIEFEPGSDMDFAALDVREKFSRVKAQLPKEIEPPIIAHYRESDVPVYITALTSQKKSAEELRFLVDRDLKEKLLRVRGMANVDVAGGRERKIIIDVDHDRLSAHGLDIRQVVDAVEKANVNLRGGDLLTGSRQAALRTLGQYSSVDEIGRTILGISPQGTSLHVRDVADVRDDYLEPESLARLNSHSAVTVYLQKESGANTVQVVKRARRVMADFKKTLPEGVSLIEISDQAEAILDAVGAVRETLFVGILLIVIILSLFLGLQSAMVVAVSIPLAVLITGAIMYFEGLSVNIMTLSGLAVGIGLLVDNSIVVVEIIQQKATGDLNRRRSKILTAAAQVTPAIVGGTLTAIVVFAPFFLLSKQLQILYSGMATTIIVALLSSLYIALTTVPSLSFVLPARLSGWRAFAGMTTLRHHLEKGNEVVEKWKRLYARLLPRFIEYRRLGLGLIALTFLLALTVFQFHIEKNFSAGSEANEFIVFVELPSGKALDVSDRIVGEVEKAIQSDKKLAGNVQTLTTRVEGWSSKIYVTLTSPRKRTLSVQAMIDRLRPLLANVGRAHEAFIYYSSAKVGQELTVNVYGEEEKTVAEHAMQLAGLFDQTPGLTDTKIRYRPGRPEVNIQVDPQRAALFGFNPTEVGNILHAQTRGLRATYFRQNGEEIETIVRIKAWERDSIVAVKRLLLAAPSGRLIPLESLADFDYALAPSEIWRNNKQRMIQVSANVKGLSLERAAEKAKALINQIPFNTDYWAEVGGDYADRLQALRDFRKAILLTFILIFVVLACLFESLLQPFLLFVSVPLSFIGVVAALLITRTPVTMGVMVGILMTGGIVVNNAILYVDHFNAHRSGPLLGNLIEAGSARLRPILLTKLTAVLGLLPMALDHRSGAELWRPMAIATIGGILSSLVLTLFVLPALLYIVETQCRQPLSWSWLRKKKGAVEKRPLRVAVPLSAVLLLLGVVVPPVFSIESLPPWVNEVVNRRVRDLLAQARALERNKDFDTAIGLDMEAVRLAPERWEARRCLLRVNAKALQLKRKEFERKRGRWVAVASEKDRAEKAWHNALNGQVAEAEHLMRRGRLIESCDHYYQILSEAPSYETALQGLENVQASLSQQLDKGGHFVSEESRQIAEGFWFYNQKKWLEAAQKWKLLLEDPSGAKKWGSVHLGEYHSSALRQYERSEQRKKIEGALAQGLEQFRRGDLKEAEVAFKNVLALDPENLQAKEYARLIPGLKERVRADVLVEVKEQQMANTLSDALEFYLKGYYDDAEKKVDLVLKEVPDHPQALALAKDIRNARGLPEAVPLEEQMSEEQMKMEALYSEGIVAFAEGRWDEARSAWESLLKKDPAHARAQQALRKLSEEGN
ncbi:MAG: efflux RND transporter permease subunit [Elusimicrobia bacterium]|nr:efflux RND transporter permease subunit [Candidatus Obscuribacterium magneticum]